MNEREYSHHSLGLLALLMTKWLILTIYKYLNTIFDIVSSKAEIFLTQLLENFKNIRTL